MAAMMRTSTLSGFDEPTRRTSRCSSARSSLGCRSIGSSPSSSRNSVPPSASSNRPWRVITAPVKEPFSWPNSSLSIRLGGTAPQSKMMSGPRGARRHLVDRLRDHLLAGAGLALDHDGRVGRRDLLDDGVDLAHARVAADQIAAAVRLRRDDLDLLVARVELELLLPDRDGAARLEVGLADADLVDERAVGRAQIDEHVAGVLLDDPAVVARDRVVAQDDVVVLHRAEA